MTQIEQLARLKELFPLNYDKFEENIINGGIMEESLNCLINDDNQFIGKDVEYRTFLDNYAIIQYNLSGQQFYTIKYFDGYDRMFGDSDCFWTGTEILVWGNPSEIFKQLSRCDFCPIKNYILDGTLAHQSELGIIFNNIKRKMEEQEKRIRLENQRIQEEKQKEIDNRQMFESLIKDFLKHGSGIIKFPYDEDIEKIS